MKMPKVIIWATDGSRAADQALSYAKDLARAGDARIVVVHVDEFGIGRTGAYSIYVNEPEIQAAIRKQVWDLKGEGRHASLKVSRVWVGGAAQVIANIAREEEADLIVTGTPRHGPFFGLLQGSVTYRLVNKAHCPVMMVPSPKSETPLVRRRRSRQKFEMQNSDHALVRFSPASL
jgi:nucleotide-binding universal stress UspA family protein